MKQATVVGACAGYAAYCLFVGSAGIRTSPDSVFYLDFSPIYPTGYSLFLKIGRAHVCTPVTQRSTLFPYTTLFRSAYCLFVGSAGIRTSPDSVFYLDFSPIYPTGYSLFL